MTLVVKGLQIGVVSRQTGLSIDTIRFYERSGILQAPRRSESGYRLFGHDDLQTLLFISRAHAMGFTLKEVKDLLQLKNTDDSTCHNVKSLLKNRIQLIRNKISELQLLEQQLTTALRKCDRRPPKLKDGCGCPVIDEIQSSLKSKKVTRLLKK